MFRFEDIIRRQRSNRTSFLEMEFSVVRQNFTDVSKELAAFILRIEDMLSKNQGSSETSVNIYRVIRRNGT
jgi:hypothetical protein